MASPKLPSPGAGRFWAIKHQPNKKTTPLKIELRERIAKDSDKNITSLSTLIGYGDTIADSAAVYEEAQKIIARAGQSDKFVGVWNGEDE